MSDGHAIVRRCMSELRDLGVPEFLIMPTMEIVSRHYVAWCEIAIGEKDDVDFHTDPTEVN